ncbi:hypothetical protein XAP412_470019 [Xanthomonas phaseoli pv. phaseoli]|uniref:Uncharacterized protein n=1 Tax=Xanthomonas campestris pv. phaseoli TaxID=317013 RepID=A0AB38E1M7_XANCH|nr:hypothetical protein XAP6984_520020 [Xanthomonas phaseoli pv. phaseoli]SON86198.1 hypothetical protein XAP412_470019 [Xanthomonas phaseoli pv. phaseoli]SON90498.1 hypothetical protein XAP7430_480068 [Xanthomonas phaseoli pv. phaseoli]SOO28192.1 hypothetical protein XAP6164_2230006 [Xanthomonas phaseoli pv. phaseoli]
MSGSVISLHLAARRRPARLLARLQAATHKSGESSSKHHQELERRREQASPGKRRQRYADHLASTHRASAVISAMLKSP